MPRALSGPAPARHHQPRHRAPADEYSYSTALSNLDAALRVHMRTEIATPPQSRAASIPTSPMTNGSHGARRQDRAAARWRAHVEGSIAQVVHRSTSIIIRQLVAFPVATMNLSGRCRRRRAWPRSAYGWTGGRRGGGSAIQARCAGDARHPANISSDHGGKPRHAPDRSRRTIRHLAWSIRSTTGEALVATPTLPSRGGSMQATLRATRRFPSVRRQERCRDKP